MGATLTRPIWNNFYLHKSVTDNKRVEKDGISSNVSTPAITWHKRWTFIRKNIKKL